ncbi:MAG: carboxynorspermidine decarboxylase [Elusimicrobia bacterium]|jgi:carboxynorspermidine decarboxylase|nr:carboxynorspermidine decarboxylase [Elusimicrobiota bacterium]
MAITDKPILEIAEGLRSTVSTPYYLIDEGRLLRNLEKVQRVRELSGAKSVLALKCFSTWAVFDLMRNHMDGTTSSSLYEARLGAEKFGKEVHAYSVAWSPEEIRAVRPLSTKIIFNSLSQLERFLPDVQGVPLGLRVNPGVSHSHFDLADPARKFSRLGVGDLNQILPVASVLSGLMFHCNCENDDLESFSRLLDSIAARFAPLLEKMEWVSLGGGIYFTKEGYPLEAFAAKLKAFSQRFNVQVYLEPGEASITQTGFLITSVLDVIHNGMDVAIVDAAVETHMLDLLIYHTDAKMDPAPTGPHPFMVAGRTCLAGDVFGTYSFPEKLKVGSLVAFADASGYTMVKKNWFNGVAMPSIVVRRLDGRVDVVKRFTYDDYVGNLS